jgi:polar amino acid transport system permease protein
LNNTSSEPEGTSPPALGVRQRLEQVSLRVPFTLKVAIVWLAIFVVLTVMFAFSQFDTAWMKDNWSFILGGIWVTIFIAACSISLATVLALMGALGRISKNPVAYGISGFYTSFFRGTPLIVQMFLIYLALPQMVQGASQGVRDFFTLEPVEAGIIALGLNYGAYMTEIFRAGIQSVSHGQREAAEALGMTYRQTMKRVVLPQAGRVIIPPTGNEFIAMLKDTALVSFLGSSFAMMEIFRRAQLMGKAAFRNMEALILVAGMYWMLTAIFTFFQRKLETRVGKGYVRAGGGTTKAAPGRAARGTAIVTGAGSTQGHGGASGYPMEIDVPEGGDH